MLFRTIVQLRDTLWIPVKRMACSIVTFKSTLVTVNKKVALVHRTPREAKLVCPSDWM